MTKLKWDKVSEYITKLSDREVGMVNHIDSRNYGLAKDVFYEPIEPLIVMVDGMKTKHILR